MMKIAVVTGASSGMGREFVGQIAEKYPWLDEIWAIARRAGELEKLKEEIQEVSVRPLPLDISREEDREEAEKAFEEREPQILLLVNAAGMGIQKESLGFRLRRLFLDRAELFCPYRDYRYLSALLQRWEQDFYACQRCGFCPSAGICRICGLKGLCGQLFQGSEPGAETAEDSGHRSVPRPCGYPIFWKKWEGKTRCPAIRNPLLPGPEPL